MLNTITDSIKIRKRKKYNHEDPYVAFRVCQEKMHTRRNRSADQEKYVKMLQWRKEMSIWLKFSEKLRQVASKKLQAQKLKLAVFEEQFRSQTFIEPRMTCSVKLADFEIQRDFLDLSKNDESEEDEIEETPLEVEEENEFEFKARVGCQYYAVRIFYVLGFKL